MNIKLKTTLKILTFVFAILPVVIMGLVGTFASLGFAGSMLGEESQTMGYALSTTAVNYFGTMTGDVSALSMTDPVKKAAAGQISDVSDQLSKISEDIKTNGKSVLDFVVMDAGGRVVFDTKGTEKGSTFFGYSDEMADKSAADGYISNISFDSGYDGETVMFFANAVRNDSDKVIGFCAEVVSVTGQLYASMMNTSFLDNGYLILADGNGNVINYNGNPVTRSDELSNGGLRSMVSTAISNVESAGIKSISYNAGGFMGSYNNVPGTQWVWMSLYPQSATSGMVLVGAIIAVAIIAVVAVAEIVVLTAQQNKIIKPMTAMIDKMRVIKEGNRDERFEVTTNNEFGRMSETFNEMLDDALLSEELHKTISDLSDNMLFEWDFTKEKMYVSDNFLAKFDVNPAESTLINGKFIDKLMDEENAERFKKDINTLIKKKDIFGGEYQVKTKAGNVIYVSMRTQCITDRLGEVLRVIGVITDIDSEKKTAMQLSERASYDFLSQLYNRSTFERELAGELTRRANSRISVLFIDVDDFKFINDRFGHSVGDEVIRYVSDKIKAKVENCGFAGRFGGDEFVLCVNDEKIIDNIEVLAMDIIDELYNGYFSKSANANLNIKASIGIALSPEHGKDGHALIAAADEAMYFVKKNGKANYHVFDAEDASNLEPSPEHSI
ncbi:MAG: diguanylate cyclase [Ruminiclostridium sp.]